MVVYLRRLSELGCRGALVIIGLSISIAAPALGFDDWTVGLNGYQPKQRDAAYYAARARPDRGQLQALARGTWRVETDLETGLTEPRLVSLANGRSVTRANDALQSVHGHVLRLERAWARENEIAHYGSSVMATEVKGSYFSPRTFSYVVLGRRKNAGSMTAPIVRGTTIDIERGTIATVKPCRSGPSFFTLGSLLTVCDGPKLELFRSLWRTEAEALRATVPHYKTDEWDEWCRGLVTAYIDYKDYDTGEDDYFEFSLYLSPRGLAVHAGLALMRRQEQCVLDRDSPFFPTIIPWRKLAPLLNPGPLRDELLALQ
jgi:hypothetical protein